MASQRDDCLARLLSFISIGSEVAVKLTELAD